jgi:serine/threonine-protein kinase RsbW
VNSDETITFETAIELVNDMSELIRLTGTFNKLFTTQKIDEKTLFYLNLIADELVTNIISYSYEDELEHTIRLQLVITPSYWTLKIQDDGLPFNPLEHENAELQLSVEERSIGGLGIHFVKQIMDEISYERTDYYNFLTMKKYQTIGNEE